MLSSAQVSDERIFVQIAAYRDSELVPTLRHCLAQADAPDKLTFGICWQRADEDSLEEFADLDAVRVMSVPFQESRGACWARRQTQLFYQGEGFTLQIDSHHRFAPGWDTSLRRLFQDGVKRGSPKPLISSYAPAYAPGAASESWGRRPLRLAFDYFGKGGPVQVKSLEMARSRHTQSLEAARFLSAHFLFTVGQFCREVPYDPKTYFFGEEPSLAIRAFTQGYDLYHPTQVVLWHFYGRGSYARHWSDNRRWWLRNERSLLRYQRLISAGGESQSLGEFGLGSVRSLQDYEKYAGLGLAKRQVTEPAVAGRPPLSGFARWKRHRLIPEHQVNIELKDATSKLNGTDQEQLLFAVWSGAGEKLGERTITGEALEEFLLTGCYRFYLYSKDTPVSWTATSVSPSTGQSVDFSGSAL